MGLQPTTLFSGQIALPNELLRQPSWQGPNHTSHSTTVNRLTTNSVFSTHNMCLASGMYSERIYNFTLAPDLVIYDNGCNLHNYCLNREPVFFKQTWFVVDRFHWPNHVGEFMFTYWTVHMYYCILPSAVCTYR